jgi:hypothetical protein
MFLAAQRESAARPPSGAHVEMSKAKSLLLAVGVLVLAGPSSGQGFYGDKKYGEFYEEEKKWVEQEANPPDYPKEQSLIEFNAGAATRNRHYIDGATLSVGKDGVIRYVIVVRTAGGAINVNFEGIRCSSRERKLYAFGRSDSTWATSRTQSWQPIRQDSYQAILSREYFCPGRLAILKAEEGVDALRRGGHPEAK